MRWLAVSTLHAALNLVWFLLIKLPIISVFSPNRCQIQIVWLCLIESAWCSGGLGISGTWATAKCTLCQRGEKYSPYINWSEAVRCSPKLSDLDDYDRHLWAMHLYTAFLNANVCLQGCAVTVPSMYPSVLTWQSFWDPPPWSFFAPAAFHPFTMPQVCLFLARIVRVEMKVPDIE